jgi:hypothetical protein
MNRKWWGGRGGQAHYPGKMESHHERFQALPIYEFFNLKF